MLSREALGELLDDVIDRVDLETLSRLGSEGIVADAHHSFGAEIICDKWWLWL